MGLDNLQYQEDITGDCRTFIIGDVHGNKDSLLSALKENEITSSDFLIFLGDTIDRGDNSRDVLDILLTRPNTLLLMGNHEDFFINLVDFIELNGYSEEEFRESSTIKNLIESMRAHWLLDLTIDELVFYCDQIKNKFYYSAEIEYKGMRIGLCHAAVPNYDWHNVVKNKGGSIWSFDNYNSEEVFCVKNVDVVVHGHVPVKNIEQKGNVFYIDTLSYKMGSVLTFLSLDELYKKMKFK